MIPTLLNTKWTLSCSQLATCSVYFLGPNPMTIPGYQGNVDVHNDGQPMASGSWKQDTNTGAFEMVWYLVPGSIPVVFNGIIEAGTGGASGEMHFSWQPNYPFQMVK